jgi:hypothetical protein
MSYLVQSCTDYYFDVVEHRPLLESLTSRESWILVTSYDGKRDLKKDELIQIFVGKRGATCEDGLSFIFDSKKLSNSFLAERAKKRVLYNVPDLKADIWRYKIE